MVDRPEYFHPLTFQTCFGCMREISVFYNDLSVFGLLFECLCERLCMSGAGRGGRGRRCDGGPGSHGQEYTGEEDLNPPSRTPGLSPPASHLSSACSSRY